MWLVVSRRLELLVALLARLDRGAQTLVDVPGKDLPAGLSVQNDGALERVEERLGLLAMLDVQHELNLEFGVKLPVEVLREALNEPLAVIYV